MSDSTLAAISESPSANESRIRSAKRKLDDAFQIIDNAVARGQGVQNASERPPPPKRANTLRSLYSTLKKYGIKANETTSSRTTSVALPSGKHTPHLSAILSRAASRTKSTLTFKSSPQSSTPSPLLPPTAEYRPSSLPSFLSRLATYKLTTYSNKPASIDAVAASKCGWINDGKDRLVCGLCNASWVVAGREGLNRDAANALIEKQRVSLMETHKNGCPWKTRQCDDSIYCVPLQSPAMTIRNINSRAFMMNSVVRDILVKHPLTASQLNALGSTIVSYTPSESHHESSSAVVIEGTAETSGVEGASEAAILTSLFGWSLVPPASPESMRKTSLTRSNSVMPSASAPPSPTSSRASSVAPQTPPPKLSRQSTGITFRLPSSLTNKPANALLQCELCQRRVGLWAFTTRPTANEATGSRSQSVEKDSPNGVPSTPSSRIKKTLPQRAFDILKEHRSYCPYVVRSTVVPSMPLPQTSSTPTRTSSSASGHKSSSSLSQFNGRNGVPGALEGWRAVLTVVLRYGMVEKQRIEYGFLAPRNSTDGANADDDSDKMDVDSVKAMVSGVKARGGKDLLKYVKGLLG